MSIHYVERIIYDNTQSIDKDGASYFLRETGAETMLDDYNCGVVGVTVGAIVDWAWKNRRSHTQTARDLIGTARQHMRREFGRSRNYLSKDRIREQEILFLVK